MILIRINEIWNSVMMKIMWRFCVLFFAKNIPDAVMQAVLFLAHKAVQKFQNKIMAYEQFVSIVCGLYEKSPEPYSRMCTQAPWQRHGMYYMK